MWAFLLQASVIMWVQSACWTPPTLPTTWRCLHRAQLATAPTTSQRRCVTAGHHTAAVHLLSDRATELLQSMTLLLHAAQIPVVSLDHYWTNMLDKRQARMHTAAHSDAGTIVADMQDRPPLNNKRCI
jgi:hypothetical protein